jgi:hypothetical protein
MKLSTCAAVTMSALAAIPGRVDAAIVLTFPISVRMSWLQHAVRPTSRISQQLTQRLFLRPARSLPQRAA